MADDMSQLLEALKALWEPTTHQTIKAQAIEVLERCSSSPEICFAAARQFVRPDNDDRLRMYGLELLGIIARKHWARLPPDNYPQLIAAFGEVIRILKPAADTRSVIDKLSQVVVDVASVAWPRVWPNFLSDMCACGALGESQLNVVLLVLHGVSLYSVSPNTEPGGGGKMAFKQEMVLDLGTYSAQLLNFVAQQVIQPRLMAPVSNVAVAAFMAFCSFSKWLSVELLLQPEHEAVIVAGLNMQNMQIKVACLDWCHCVVKHTARPGDEPLLVRLLGTIIAYTNSVSAAGVGSSDQYQLLKACCSIVSDAVIKQQSLLARNPQIASAFSSCMLFFSQAPGIELASNAMSSWKVWLVADGDIPPCNMDEAVAMVLFGAIFAKIERPTYGLDGGSVDSIVSSYDYNDKDELSQAWALLKGRCITIARLLARRFSSLCLQKCGELLISQLQVGTASDATLSLLDNVSFCALTCRDLNDPDITSFGDGHEVLAALPEEQKHRVAASTAVALQLTSALVTATNSLASAPTCSPSTLLCLVRALGSLSPAFGYDPSSMVNVCAAVFSILKGPGAADQLLRAKCCTSLVKMCVAAGHCISSVASTFLSTVQELESSGTMGSSDIVNLYEAVALLGNSISPRSAQHQFYAAALSPIVGSLTPSHVARETWFAPALASPSSADNIEAAKLERERLQHVLAILVVTFRRAKHPNPIGAACEPHALLGFMDTVLQVVLRVLQSLHGLWAPDFKPLIAHPWHDVFRGDEQDAALTEAQRGNVAVAHLWERGPPSQLCQYTRVIREQVYQLTHRLVSFGVNEFWTVLRGCGGISALCSNLSNCESRHIRMFVKMVLHPVLALLPLPLFPEVSPIIAPLFAHIFSRVNAGYIAILERWSPEATAAAAAALAIPFVPSSNLTEICFEQTIHSLNADTLNCLFGLFATDVPASIPTVAGGSDGGSVATMKEEEVGASAAAAATKGPSQRTGGDMSFAVPELAALYSADRNISTTAVNFAGQALLWPNDKSRRVAMLLMSALLRNPATCADASMEILRLGVANSFIMVRQCKVDFNLQTTAMELFGEILLRAFSNAACVPHVCAVTGQPQQSVVQLVDLLRASPSKPKNKRATLQKFFAASNDGAPFSVALLVALPPAIRRVSSRTEADAAVLELAQRMGIESLWS